MLRSLLNTLNNPSCVSEDRETSASSMSRLPLMLLMAFVAMSAVAWNIPRAAALQPLHAFDIAHFDPEMTETLQQFVLSALNTSVDPCSDFYNFSCGSWIANTPLPPGESSYPRSIGMIQQSNNDVLHTIVDDPSSGQKVYDFNAACMNTEVLNSLGLEPLQPLLGIANTISNIDEMMIAVGMLHKYNIEPLFSWYVDIDAKKPTINIGQMGQGGLTLPSASLYLEDDEGSKALRGEFLGYMVKLFVQTDVASKSEAMEMARTVLAIETRLANFSLPPDQMEDPFELYNKLDLNGLDAAAPQLPWNEFLYGTGFPNATQFNVDVPSFFTDMAAYISSLDVADWKAYLTWHTINNAASLLTPKIAETQFDFFGKVLMGIETPPPRWQFCVGQVDSNLGEILGNLFAQATFGATAKDDAEEMVQAIEAQMKIDLQTVTWMDNTTRKRAIDKLAHIRNQIGYPANPSNYSETPVVADQFFNNVMTARSIAFAKSMADVGKKADPNAWSMTADTVNAYYDPTRNEMVFPAGILQFPYYSLSIPASMNFGGGGVIMGHENTHGFDNEGKDYFSRGRLIDWWNEQTKIAFEEKVQCVVNQYDQYEVLPGIYVNGKLTENENIADIGGTKNSYHAYEKYIGAAGNETSIVAPFTNLQLWFVAYAQGWCEVATDQALMNQVKTDPHSPARYRVIGPLQDLPEFAQIWNCPVGSYMNPAHRCEVW